LYENLLSYLEMARTMTQSSIFFCIRQPLRIWLRILTKTMTYTISQKS